MSKVTNKKPKMWGTSIVGFGTYRYKYQSGREGESAVVGFSSRKGDITLHLASGFPRQEELLSNLGKYKTGKGCLYIRPLSDVDLKTLEQVIDEAAAERTRKHP